MSSYDRVQWADLAVRGILSKKERESTRQELLDHIDDHADALMAAGLPRSRAVEAACAAMGDPEETARLLRKAHQPMLTRLLRLCRWALGVLVAVLLWNGLLALGRMDALGELFDPPPARDTIWEYRHDPLPGEVAYRRLLHPGVRRQLGDYAMEVQWVSVSYLPPQPALDLPEGAWRVSAMVRFTGKHPLADPIYSRHGYFFPSAWVLESGGEAAVHTAIDGTVPGEGEERLYVNRQGQVLHQSWYILAGVFSAQPETVTLSYLHRDAPLEIPLDLKGGQEYGQAP